MDSQDTDTLDKELVNVLSDEPKNPLMNSEPSTMEDYMIVTNKMIAVLIGESDEKTKLISCLEKKFVEQDIINSDLRSQVQEAISLKDDIEVVIHSVKVSNNEQVSLLEQKIDDIKDRYEIQISDSRIQFETVLKEQEERNTTRISELQSDLDQQRQIFLSYLQKKKANKKKRT